MMPSFSKITLIAQVLSLSWVAYDGMSASARPPDTARAVGWLSKASNGNYIIVEYALGCLYLYGEGISKDTATAAKLFIWRQKPVTRRPRITWVCFMHRVWAFPKTSKKPPRCSVLLSPRAIARPRIIWAEPIVTVTMLSATSPRPNHGWAAPPPRAISQPRML